MMALLIIPLAVLMGLGFGFQEAWTMFQRQTAGDARQLPHTKLAALRTAIWAIGATAIVLLFKLHWHYLLPMALLTYGAFAPVHRLMLNSLSDQRWWYMGPKLYRRKPGHSIYDSFFHLLAKWLSKQPSPYYRTELPGQLAFALELAVLIGTTYALIHNQA
jgi:hypothetical protein